MLIDAHAHLDKYGDDDLDEVLSEIQRRRILTMSVSVDPESFASAESIALESSLVIPAFGIHPEQAPSFVDSVESMHDLIDRSPMIGEIGLDHRFVTDESQYEAQRQVFAAFLERARAHSKVVNVHCAGAERETLDMLASYRIERAIIHWYSGPLDVLFDMISAGYLFTVGVEVQHSAHVQQIARAIPAAQLLTETDNPGGLEWLTGEVGRPSHIPVVLEELGRLRGALAADLVATIHANAARLLLDDPHLHAWRSLLAS